ncbi:hypothetical protein AQUCO_07800018v1 [Aquilegia coerulea]|uniref:Protein kinase domain-containing protein n=1 Tax=Aquilegia coerulea TaxID=218851 RepID=A0A2G5C804_AQUCA|nr:hypothetical protein AQUCO_07800018v1 [Aquilegia coerulea]
MGASHRNLIKLYGYCFQPEMKALVYEYMEHGSLDKVLYESGSKIEWAKLYDIAIQVAKGLFYLHDGLDKCIIHHDIKPSNVLLDKNHIPKITDFGMAKLVERDVSLGPSSKTRGTDGFIAPEIWMPGSKVSCKCDVFSFGMMLFEVLGRRKNGYYENWFPGNVWKSFNNGQLDYVIQDCGITSKDKENAKLLSVVAFWCTQFEAKDRPFMNEVVLMLQGRMDVGNPPPPFPARSSSSNPQSVLKVIPKIYSLANESLDISSKTVDAEHDESINSSKEEQKKEERVQDYDYTSSKSVEMLQTKLQRSNPEKFTESDLRQFTSNFKYKIGSNEFGNFFKGCFADGVEIAVKVLIERDGVKQLLMAEMNTVGLTYHRNIVKLYGYCSTRSMRALVYEHMSNGSLNQVLYENHDRGIERKKLYDIAIETAKGLSYLHSYAGGQIIHNSIMPSSVFLDSNLSPKITNFELAKLMEKGATYYTLDRVRGIPGSAAPEMLMPAPKITYKCDVYNYGIMLLDILTMSRTSKSRMLLCDTFNNEGLDTAIDLCGIPNEGRKIAKIMCMVAFWCVQDNPEIRPSMDQVVMMLERKVLDDIPPYPSMHYDDRYD